MNTPRPDRDANPFLAPVGDRDPTRRLRGRLVAPVTIITAGAGDQQSGLTVSSLLVAEGEPPMVYFLVGSATDLFYAIDESDKFVVHVCEGRHRELADVFAGLRPSPGGMFAGQSVTQTAHGPRLDDIPTRAYCSVLALREESYSVIISAEIDGVGIADLDDPLAFFRGRYRGLASP